MVGEHLDRVMVDGILRYLTSRKTRRAALAEGLGGHEGLQPVTTMGGDDL